MSESLKSQFYKLELLSQLKSATSRKILLKEFCNDSRFCKAVREIARNTVKRNIKLSSFDKKRLRRYKNLILSLSKKRKSQTKTKALVQQVGRGLFLPILVPLVASLIGELIAKK